MSKKYLTPILLMIFAIACDDLIPEATKENFTLEGPIEGLTSEQSDKFNRGDIAFSEEVFSPATGLGPYFVASSCASCHVGAGKGHPSNTITRFGQSDSLGNVFLGNGGPQIQNRALAGFKPENIPPEAIISLLTPPAVTGLGFLAALSDEQILSNADPNDENNDGISGVPNFIDAPDYFLPNSYHRQVNGKYIGRFGKKASSIDLLHLTSKEYNENMGITSIYIPEEPSIYNSPNPTPDRVTDPEVSNTTIDDVIFYLMALKAPLPRSENNNEVVNGKSIFLEIGCDDCHTPTWTTPTHELEALSEKSFHPYTDLLLHDMGPGLDDGYTEGTAETSEWRTPPLWGIGLSKRSQGGSYYLMHDGRASSILDAILLHGGEANGSRVRFESLTPIEKNRLIEFLESL